MNKPNTKFVIVISVLVTAVVTFAIFAVLMINNKIYFGTKNTDEIIKEANICSDEQITKAVDFASSTSGARDFVEGIDEIADSVKQKPEYKSDSNCLGILTLYYMVDNNRDGLSEVIIEFEALGNDGLYVRNDLSQYASLPIAKQTLETLKELDSGENTTNE
jgi:hypothetical protein